MMNEFQRIWTIIRKTGIQHIIYTFILYFFIFCALIHLADPEIQNFGDALWFGFNVITTIGLGDYTVTSFLGRILVAVLGLYGIFFFALIPGILTSYYLDKMEERKKNVLASHPELTDLKGLSSEQKQTISRSIKEKKGRYVSH